MVDKLEQVTDFRLAGTKRIYGIGIAQYDALMAARNDLDIDKLKQEAEELFKEP